MNKMTGAVVASVVAGLFAANAFAASSTTKDSKDSKTTSAKVKCSGVNDCKGKGECSQDDHGCSGNNSCKGKGWVTMDSAKACTAKGGKVLADNDAKK
jgi:hypothetical protein